jgi:hypothetical protein
MASFFSFSFSISSFVINKDFLFFFKSQAKEKVEKATFVKPIVLNVELLLVTDLSIYEDHKRYSGSTDPNTVFLHMKIYYSHLFNGVFFFVKFNFIIQSEEISHFFLIYFY